MSGNLTEQRGAVDGIFGFGQQGLSVFTQLVSQGIIPNAFSHCLKGGDYGGKILVSVMLWNQTLFTLHSSHYSMYFSLLLELLQIVHFPEVSFHYLNIGIL